MNRISAHEELHYIHRTGWLRAAVLGANDGILSTASLMIGIAAAAASMNDILLAGIAALVAGALSMAAGEYVSVSSQSDIERADLETERKALRDNPDGEHEELAQIYMARGVPDDLARQVATALTDSGALEAHARDELGISDMSKARPFQAAWSSALSFAVGATLPIVAAVLAPTAQVGPAIAVVSLLGLTLLGVLSARAGGAPVIKAVTRIVFWGMAAMAVTALVGRLFGVAV
ncbi:MAG: VIT family protein [Hyphomonadaceae bacterium]|nr:VIT family protein [Hyphomonadaceae bacterium]